MIIHLTKEASNLLYSMATVPQNHWDRTAQWWPENASDGHMHTTLDRWAEKNLLGKKKRSFDGPNEVIVREFAEGPFSLSKDQVKHARKLLAHYQKAKTRLVCPECRSVGGGLPARCFDDLERALDGEKPAVAEAAEDPADAEELAKLRAEAEAEAKDGKAQTPAPKAEAAD